MKALFDVELELNEQDDINLKFFSEIEARRSLEITADLIEQFSDKGNL